jgi:hypothetical protein
MLTVLQWQLGKPFSEICLDPIERNSLLLHRITLSHSHRLIIQGVKVDGDAEGCSDLILSAIPSANRT